MTTNAHTTTSTTLINPWDWQDRLGFSHAIATPGAPSWLICAGQGGVDGQGATVTGGMRAQVEQAFDNLEEVLRTAGFDLSDVVRLNLYTTDVGELFAQYDAVLGRLAAAGIQPASTLLGVAALALPDMQIEIEATAWRH